MTLDTAATQAKYKYSPHSLPDGTKSPVVVKCDFCEEPFEMEWKAFLFIMGRDSKLHGCPKCNKILQAYVKTDRSVAPPDFRRGYVDGYLTLDWVDFEETRRLYRYDPRKVAYGSVEDRMMVVVKCKRCGLRQSVKLFGLTKFSQYNGYCKSCGKQVSEKILRKQRAPSGEEFDRTESERHRGVFRQETIRRLGADPDEMPSNSSAPVVAKCCICGGPTETKLGYFTSKEGRVSCSKDCRRALLLENRKLNA